MMIYGIQFLRIIATIMILLHHLQGHFDFELPLNTLGKFCVSLFICISGFLAGYLGKIRENYTLSDSIVYCKKKLIKFYPLYFIIFLFSLLISIFSCIRHSNWLEVFNGIFFIKLITFLTMTQSWIPIEDFYYAFNPLCWYMSTIMFCYFCQPYLLYKLGKNSIKKNIIIIFIEVICLIFITILSKDYPNVNSWLLYFCPATRLLNFSIALLLGLIMKKYRLNLSRYIASSLELITIILCYIFLKTDVDIIWQRNVFFMPISLLTIIIFTISNGFMVITMKNKIFIHLANLTFIIFLVHQKTFDFLHAVNRNYLHINNIFMQVFSIFLVIILSEILFIITTKINCLLVKDNEKK